MTPQLKLPESRKKNTGRAIAIVVMLLLAFAALVLFVAAHHTNNR